MKLSDKFILTLEKFNRIKLSIVIPSRRVEYIKLFAQMFGDDLLQKIQSDPNMQQDYNTINIYIIRSIIFDDKLINTDSQFSITDHQIDGSRCLDNKISIGTKKYIEDLCNII